MTKDCNLYLYNHSPVAVTIYKMVAKRSDKDDDMAYEKEISYNGGTLNLYGTVKKHDGDANVDGFEVDYISFNNTNRTSINMSLLNEFIYDGNISIYLHIGFYHEYDTDYRSKSNTDWITEMAVTDECQFYFKEPGSAIYELYRGMDFSSKYPNTSSTKHLYLIINPLIIIENFVLNGVDRYTQFNSSNGTLFSQTTNLDDVIAQCNMA